MGHGADLNHLRIAVLRSHGDAPVELRTHIEQFSARIAGRATGEAAILPPGVRDLVEKIARHPNRITDDDLAHLRHEGYSEDALFEIVVCAAVGAGAGRFERAMEALADAPAQG
jgi:hypothetical protein